MMKFERAKRGCQQTEDGNKDDLEKWPRKRQRLDDLN